MDWVSCRQETTAEEGIPAKASKNEIQSVDRGLQATIVFDAVLNRTMTEVIYGNRNRTYAFPPSVVTIR